MYKIILGANSDVKLNLLKQINLKPDIIVNTNIDKTRLKYEKPLDYSKRMAFTKAEYLIQKYKQSYIICSDTCVLHKAKLIGKLKSPSEAFDIISSLSGKRHYVYTTMAFINTEMHIHLKTVVSYVKFRCLSKYEIDSYIKNNYWVGKYAGYSLEGKSSSFIHSIGGSYTSIMGIPLDKLLNLLDLYKIKCV